MMLNCFEGYLTDACKKCDFWKDGSDGSLGCACPGPIDHCEAFVEAYKKAEEFRRELRRKEGL